MDAQEHRPQSPAERLICWTIEGTWVLWLIGGLYIVGPLLGWVLLGMALAKPSKGAGRQRGWIVTDSIVHVWTLGMGAMLVILWIGHAANDLGFAQTLKSSIGWAKGWALLAVYPYAAYQLDIRPEVVIRAICRLGLQTLLLVPLFVIAPFIGLPPTLYVSPLKVLGGSTSEFFAVVLYTTDPDAGIKRWQFFAPWSSAAGMVAVIYTLLALQERRRLWKVIGVTAGLAIALMSESRLALVALVVVIPLARMAAQVRRPIFWLLGAAGSLLAGLLSQTALELVEQLTERFTHARPASSRVRAALGRIALDRWSTEAPLFGHGIVERGPHLVEYMPIGSHHTWFGLLFVKGLTGFIALAAPLGYTLFMAIWLATRGPIGRMAFAMTMVLLLYSFGENLEVLGYLIWPGLMMLGVACRQARNDRAAARPIRSGTARSSAAAGPIPA
jgi:hypothetical protein